MREIVFRGKSKDTGEWVEGFLNPPCNICFETAETLNGEDVEVWNDHAVDPETVGQYIGLTDRNGVRIFEGDVVKLHQRIFGRDQSEVGVVHWDPERSAFLRTPGKRLMTSVCQCVYEVIGNVHDHPQLCEVS